MGAPGGAPIMSGLALPGKVFLSDMGGSSAKAERLVKQSENINISESIKPGILLRDRVIISILLHIIAFKPFLILGTNLFITPATR
jgi:hypothetical protein